MVRGCAKYEDQDTEAKIYTYLKRVIHKYLTLVFFVINRYVKDRSVDHLLNTLKRVKLVKLWNHVQLLARTNVEGPKI